MSGEGFVVDSRRHSFAIVDNEIVLRHGAKLGAHGLAVYLALAVTASRDGSAVVYQSTLAKRAGVSVRKLRDVLAVLESERLVKVEHRRREGSAQQLASRYVLLPVAKDASAGARAEAERRAPGDKGPAARGAGGSGPAARGAGGSGPAARGAGGAARGAGGAARGAEYVQDVTDQDVSSKDRVKASSWPVYVRDEDIGHVEALGIAPASMRPEIAALVGRAVDRGVGAGELAELFRKSGGPTIADRLRHAIGFRIGAAL